MNEPNESFCVFVVQYFPVSALGAIHAFGSNHFYNFGVLPFSVLFGHGFPLVRSLQSNDFFFPLYCNHYSSNVTKYNIKLEYKKYEVLPIFHFNVYFTNTY